ncbi:MAG: SH3 domain-containing protein, partial [Moorellaceae bacterium]
MVRRSLSLLLLLGVVAAALGYLWGYPKVLRVPPLINGERDKVRTTPPAPGYYVQVPVADVRAEASSSAELVTQALLGDEVKVLSRGNDGWLRGQVPDGYIGWLKTQEVVEEAPPESAHLAVVMVPLARLYQESAAASQVLVEAVLGTDLPLIDQKPGWLKVWLPGRNTAWLPEKEAEIWPQGK